MSERFWPGYEWRVLAHERTGKGRKGTYTGRRVEDRSSDHDGLVEFDELVIDHWFHLEQMGERDWWMYVAGWMINVSIDATGKPTVRMEQEDAPDEVAAYRRRVQV
jgi:hypothetical protein